jgi:hypothetical protein
VVESQVRSVCHARAARLSGGSGCPCHTSGRKPPPGDVGANQAPAPPQVETLPSGDVGANQAPAPPRVEILLRVTYGHSVSHFRAPPVLSRWHMNPRYLCRAAGRDPTLGDVGAKHAVEVASLPRPGACFAPTMHLQAHRLASPGRAHHTSRRMDPRYVYPSVSRNPLSGDAGGSMPSRTPFGPRSPAARTVLRPYYIRPRSGGKRNGAGIARTAFISCRAAPTVSRRLSLQSACGP